MNKTEAKEAIMGQCDRSDTYIGTYLPASRFDMDELADLRVINKRINEQAKNHGFYQVIKVHGRGKNRFARTKEYYRAKYPGIRDGVIKWKCAQTLPIQFADRLDVYLYQYSI